MSSNDDSQWWHIVLATPFAVAIGAILGGGIGTLIGAFFVISYPFALVLDAKHLRSNGQNKNILLWIIAGIFTLISFGVLSYLITPYYLLKR